MSVRRGIIATLAVVAIVLAVVGLRHERARGEAPAPAAGPPRIVTLSPDLTATLYAIGAGSLVVAVSDYCVTPPGATPLPRVGTALTPSYEAIARLAPTLILTAGGSRTRELQELAPTRLLPWLTLDQVTASTRELGRLTGHEPEARALAERLATRLSAQPPAGAPRVLLVLGGSPGQLDDVWFVKDESLHGAALRAAGGRNAVARASSGAPRLSLTQVLELDPEQIIVLTTSASAADAALYRESWRKLTPLAAVESGRIAVVGGADVFADGPSILELVTRLAGVIAKLRGGS
ncbi:MAG: helical backbone metal receptor [Sorangiineae bacterium]|nr:helical backbone metal receptor [Polyangiaceae bacterium]MEB2322318.1 helical backbone metal receptor [Sorangiineae bacterium]